jgi:hypothetical protein
VANHSRTLETEATSCQDYKDHLSATLDGFYNIYPTETEIKKRVFCKGITDNEPTVEYPHEEFSKFNLVFRTEYLTFKNPICFFNLMVFEKN